MTAVPMLALAGRLSGGGWVCKRGREVHNVGEAINETTALTKRRETRTDQTRAGKGQRSCPFLATLKV